MTIDEQKKLVLGILKNTGAVIAGGAVRNWEFNKLANDFDIYHNGVGNKVGANLLIYGYAIAEKTEEEKEQHYPFKQIIYVSKFIHPKFPSVDLINVNVKDIYNAHQHFDFGICKILMDQHGDIYKHPEFNTDVRNKTLTMVDPTRDITLLRRSLTKHLPKLESYFPGFKLK